MRHEISIFVLVLLSLIGVIFIYSWMQDEGPSDEYEPLDEDLVRSNESIYYTFEVENIYDHDRSAFTQGLVYEDGAIFEGTGLYGESTLRKVDPTTGEVLQEKELSSEYFGEGITIFGDRIIQLTWKSNLGLVYDKTSFEQLETFEYDTEGWGITHDGEHLIMSDGTSTLHFLEPMTYEELYVIEVLFNGTPIERLNELEYINGEIYANIWQEDYIVVIDPLSGEVVKWIDLEGLLDPEDYSHDVNVLNGIAYDERNDRLFVTGKLWPKMFEIELVKEV